MMSNESRDYMAAQDGATSEAPSANENAVDKYETVEAWFVDRISQQKNVSIEQVVPTVPFSDLGIESVEATALAGELSSLLGTPVAPTLFYDYPDVESLSRHLVEKSSGGREASNSVADQQAEQIAIIGMACRVPGASSIEDYWKLLDNGVDSITETPAERWPVDAYYDARRASPGKMNTRWGGFIAGVDEFDASFFGISPREAMSMDPQQRLLLQTAWHALEDAGVPPHSLAGSNTGVFVGISGGDYKQLQLDHNAGVDAYSGTGNSASIAANRISYFLDLHGPSWAVDTACSSSLVALHQARVSLLNGECDLAIVAGVNLILAPETTIIFSQANMMAADGRCKTFDERADGYVRGEGCCVVVLKRLSETKNRIHALIGGSAVNQDGKSNGLTAPNGLAQRSVFQQALYAANISASRISYVEAHGTGTSLGDPIEVGAINAVYGQPTVSEKPLWIGSVKTNIGHLEAAAGLAGLIKIVLAMQHYKIPSNLHFTKLNPQISFEGTRCAIATSPQAWPAEAQPRMAAVSSFSFGGTNAHVILQEAPIGNVVDAPSGADSDAEASCTLLAFSAKSETALRQLSQRYVDLFAKTPISLKAICHMAATQRSHHAFRLALPSRSREQAVESLSHYAKGESSSDIYVGNSFASPRGKIAFLFTGQGTQYVGAGRELYRTNAVFREALNRCDVTLQSLFHTSLSSIIDGENEIARTNTSHAQPALFALEYALAAMWKSCGIEPHYLLGHSIGEYVAACLAGVFSLEDGLKLVFHRGRLMQEEASEGAMYAVHAPADFIVRFVESLDANPLQRELVGVAAYNSPQDIVLSGNAMMLEIIVADLRDKQASVAKLHVNRAFHSPYMHSMVESFRRCAETVTYHRPSLPVISNVTGKVIDDAMCSADYWVAHVLAPVRFSEGMQTLAECGCKTFIEIGPHPVLTSFGPQTVADGLWLPTLRHGVHGDEQFHRSLGRWYAAGGIVDWAQWARAHDDDTVTTASLQLPLYPFQTDRYWFQAGVHAKPTSMNAHPLIGRKIDIANVSSRCFENVISTQQPWFIDQHRVFGVPILSASTAIEWTLAALAEDTKKPLSEWVLQNIELRRAMIISEDRPVTAQLVLDEEKDTYRVNSFSRDHESPTGEWIQHMSLSAAWSMVQNDESGISFETFKQSAMQQSVDECYKRWEQSGLNYGPAFRGLRALWKTEKQALAWIDASSISDRELAGCWAHPIILDACLHALVAFPDTIDSGAALLPVGIERLSIRHRLPPRLWCHITWHATHASGRYVADLRLYNEAGESLGFIDTLQLVFAPQSAISYTTGNAGRNDTQPERTSDATVKSDVEEDEAFAQQLIDLRILMPEAAKETILEYLRSRAACVLQLGADHQTALSASFKDLRLSDLGLDSILAIRLHNHVLADLLVDIPISHFIGDSVVSELVDLIWGQLILKQLMVAEGEVESAAAEMEVITI